jgi:hypothetical protein
MQTLAATFFGKISAFLAASAGVIWLGGSIIRAALAFDLFIPGTLTFKPTMTNEAAAQTIRLFGVTAFYTLVSYGVFIVFGAGLWLAARRFWKPFGGVFMAGLLFIIYAPVECVQMWYDFQVVMLVQGGLSPSMLDMGMLEQGKSLIVKRFSVLSGLPLLAAFGYFTAIFMLIARTLRQKPHEKADEKLLA